MKDFWTGKILDIFKNQSEIKLSKMFSVQKETLMTKNKKKSYTPTQIVPSPSNPSLHAHEKDPITFLHVAFRWQS